ncbi:hypothetical protein [Methylorubrum sp. GM97]|uniref:hypothetical protein n=1 Tax=Methylorubrum sp. GM97 TaxID=2938232 RepID=UPI002186AA0C|nr:hypothetical protein [Methylorubrum sp. GM97]BDL41828.1 hypothetical protein MSPGM_44180 [Methylorubrum sp. GM97]
MDWVGPAVTAAVVSGIISIVSLFIGRSTTLITHRQKLDADRQLAERKVEADIALARAKFEYDREQAIFKRKFELAEHMLSDAYQLRSLMEYVRNGFSFSGEATSRVSDGAEREEIKRLRDSYFVPQARLQAENKFLSNMLARRTACHAHFGLEADKAFELFHQSLHQTRVASQLLVEWTAPGEDVDKETMNNLKADIWKGYAEHKGKDNIGRKIEEAVGICEKLCQPVLGSSV